MADTQKRIANKIFKVLPMYEESFAGYNKYLDRIIVELQGEEQTDILREAIIALKGLYNAGQDVTHDTVRRIIMRYTSRISER